ncbi:inhibitor of Bruton tyrosine kinase-like isoform X2 [Gigantopelta aegis]|uniref:inhibitor of Bruton tyrosine kinase-like isoform X2 n=1 Tax=Gigantopelta aegis TaxID=1735272 RepID=UPI001B88AFCD|nr:inhibitor of Bruton tyrosine kinase-like isoform X2 [Gigantopelta aegis]
MSRMLESECTVKCRSRKHALEVNVSITKGTLQQIQSFARLCHHGTELCDSAGRLALHMAASCGKRDVVEWLIMEKHADQTAKDSESGWTALHRSLFYGNIDVARLLIQHGSDMYSRDNEGLGSLDIVMKDRPQQISFSSKEPNELYAWGDNANFNLGHASGHRRPVPEVVDQFKKLNISIKQVVMCKYHTVFLSQTGQVYTCGHGHGGRLGHNDEVTCLIPKLVDCVGALVCTQVAASRDHTVLLMESGNVYTCGLNDCHQLGQFPAPEKSLTPKQVNTKVLKGRKIVGVCAGRFHTVLYTCDAVYTFGLNAGQLGHPKADRQQSHLRQVSALNHADISFLYVTCSDAATVCLTVRGDIYVLHEYQCRKIASRWTDVSKLLVSGGNLDHSTDLDVLRDKGGSELIIALLNTTGKVFLWRAASPVLKRCQWAIRRQLYVTDVVIGGSNLAFVTDQAEAFIGFWSQKKTASQKEISTLQNKDCDEFGKMTLIDLLLKDEVEDVPVRRVPNAHRATTIHCDTQGSNFTLLQVIPNCCLSDLPSVTSSEMSRNLQVVMDEADEYDSIHDIVVQTRNKSWPAHQYILASRSDHFRKFVFGLARQNTLNDKPVIAIDDVQPEIMEQIIKFIYTDTCDLLTPGARFDHIMSPLKNKHGEKCFDVDSGISDESDLITLEKKRMSAYEVQLKKKKAGKNVKDKEDSTYTGRNPIKLLQEVAKKLGVKGLSKRLEAVKFVNGVVQAANKYLATPKVKFERTKLSELHDVCIKADDNTTVHCHKCILVARLEYFHSMLGSGWIETSDTRALSLPIPGDILLLLLDFLYTDESVILSDCCDAELLCNVLVVADQLLVIRLKEICEVSLVNLLNFRNVAELLEFSSVYNADQLKASCQQMISLNMAALLEGRYLDVLSDETIGELKEYYRNLIPGMARRLVTPFDESPSRDYLESLPSCCHDNSVTPGYEQLSRKKKKRRSRTQSVTEDVDRSDGAAVERQISVSSDISIDDDPAGSNPDTVFTTSLVTDIALQAAQPKEQKHTSAFIHVPKRNISSPWGYKSPSSPLSQGPILSPPGHPAASPESPGSTLRDIMAAEEQQQNKQHSLGKGVSPGKFSWKDVKKQQSQREQQSRLKKDNSEVSEKEIGPVSQSPKPSICPWGSVNKVVNSFRNLIIEEKVHTTVKPDTSVASKDMGNVSLRQSEQQRQMSIPVVCRSEPLMIPNTSQNAWLTGHIPSPPQSSVSFSDIVKDEQQRRETLDRASKKPLGLIQVEEQAMHELLQHYRAYGCPTEHITVERVPQALATPLWKRDSQGACGGQ